MPDSKLIVVKESPGKGRGVFATRDIKKGEILETSTVLLIPHNDVEFIQHTFLSNYTFHICVGDVNHVGIALGTASLYNHSKKHNAAWVINTKIIIVQATRAIKGDSEIFVDYGWDKKHLKEAGIEEK